MPVLQGSHMSCFRIVALPAVCHQLSRFEQTQKIKNRRTARVAVLGDLKAASEVFRNEALSDALLQEIDKFRQLLLELAV